MRDRLPPEPPEVDRPSWTCPGCETTFDGRPEIVTEDPLECYCSEECYAANGGDTVE